VDRGFHVATTDRNALELERILVQVVGLTDVASRALVEQVIAPFQILFSEAYEHLRLDAEARLSQGGKSDWPLLAAALALDGEIWSDDRDFFGVGVPVWSTPNVHLARAD
jgi:predicted nucleic acid-binding protein